MHILNTDTLTHLHAGNPRVIYNLREVEDPDVGITIISNIEMLRGRIDFVLKAATGAELLRAQQLFIRTEELLAQLLVIPFDEATAVQFERLNSVTKLRKIGQADLLIESIVLTHRATLVTRNLRHFQEIPGLKLTNWVD